MRRFLCSIILIFLAIAMTGCENKTYSDKPVYYSDGEIKKYVSEAYGNEYQFVSKTSYTDEKNVPAYEYKFKNSNGHYFSIYSRSYYVTKSIGSKYNTEYYTKLLKSNYTKTLLDFKKDEISNLINKNNFKYKIDNSYDDNLDLIIYFNNESEFETLSKVVYDLYNLIDFKYNETYMHSDMSYNRDAKILIDGNLYIKCNMYLDSNHNENKSKYISSFRVPINTVFDEELTLNEVRETIKRDYANKKN